MIREYVQAGAADRGDSSALVTMPTGTGKTAVIAYSLLLPELSDTHRLVLTPWDALVNQALGDLGGRLWDEKLRIDRPKNLPEVERLPSVSRLDRLQSDQPRIFVGTIQGIMTVVRRLRTDGVDPATAFARFGLVVVDEGHYEPAPEWSNAIRALHLPSALLTATPYRNDHLFFTLDENRWRFRLTHRTAQEKLFLRSPEFRRVDAHSADEFARAVVKESDAVRERHTMTRVIVRANDEDGIRELVRALVELGQDVIGVHHNFETAGTRLRRKVPDPSDVTARYWVHQNKLIEGIDDPEFRVLAFFDDLTNDRAIVQQIGRVLRNPQRRGDDATAVVIGRNRDLRLTWEAYEGFDQDRESEAIATMPDYIKNLIEAQPRSFYYKRNYRTRIDLASADAWHQFRFPLRTRVFRSRQQPGPSLAELADATAHEWLKADRLIYPTRFPDDDTAIVPFVKADNSPLLKTAIFIEPEFGYTFLRLDGELLLFYDSRGGVPEAIDKLFAPIPPDDLAPLFPLASSTITSVSLVNTDVSRRAARSRSLRAIAIDDLAPDLSDYSFVCTTTEGYTEFAAERTRRYVSMSRSRIVDYNANDGEYSTYSGWLNGLVSQIRGGAAGVGTFGRYAQYIDTPAITDPAHVLIDVEPTRFAHVVGDKEVQLDLQESGSDVANGSFTIVANDVAHSVSVEWDRLLERYRVTAPSLKDEHFVDTRDDTELVTRINQEQMLRVVPESNVAIYTRRHFYKPTIPGTGAGAFQLLDLLTPIAALEDEDCTEKGKSGSTITDGNWDPKSIFGMVSAIAPSDARPILPEFAAIFPNADFVFCSDMGREVADFILCQGDERIAFVHAKAGDGNKYSASALHVVSQQATKNLLYLQPLEDKTKPNMQKWPYPWKTTNITGTAPRLRQGAPVTPTELWARARRVIANPRAEREVWLVLGRTLSVAALEQQRKKRPPAAEVINLITLLSSTWSSVSQVGARLRVFCSP
jgi:superfamily II DNA or RNA helicase